jgi:hypothetical protein
MRVRKPSTRQSGVRIQQPTAGSKRGGKRESFSTGGTRELSSLMRDVGSTGTGSRWMRRCGICAVGRGKTGPHPTDRGKSGVKRRFLTEGHGVPLALTSEGAHRRWRSAMGRRFRGIYPAAYQTPRLSVQSSHTWEVWLLFVSRRLVTGFWPLGGNVSPAFSLR